MAPLKYVTCPFYQAHRLEELYLPKHIQKCLKNFVKEFPDRAFVVCPLNALHYVFTDEMTLNDHIDKCSSRSIIDRQLYNEQSFGSSIERPIDYVINSCRLNNLNIGKHDDWDDDDDVESVHQVKTSRPSYNPELHMLDLQYARTPPLELGKAGKKQWRLAEQERLVKLKNKESIESVTFPCVDGRTRTIAEFRVDLDKNKSNYGNELHNLKHLPEMTPDEKMSKALMRTENPRGAKYVVKQTKETKVVANIFSGWKDLKTREEDEEPPTSDGVGQGARRKIRRPPPRSDF